MTDTADLPPQSQALADLVGKIHQKWLEHEYKDEIAAGRPPNTASPIVFNQFRAILFAASNGRLDARLNHTKMIAKDERMAHAIELFQIGPTAPIELKKPGLLLVPDEAEVAKFGGAATDSDKSTE